MKTILYPFILPVLLIVSNNIFAQGLYTEKTPMPTDRLGLCTALVDGKIYALGGIEDESAYLSAVEVYDPVTDTWEIKSPMPTSRAVAGCAAVDGNIYVIGGVNSEGILSIVEVYDPAANTWDTLSPLPSAACDVATEVVNGKIYVFGGTKRTGSAWGGINNVQEYDPVSDTWTTKAPMPTARWCASTCVVDDKIYVIGGNIQYPEIASEVEVYDPETDTWDTTKIPMPTKRYSLATSFLNRKIYAFGGWFVCSPGHSMYKKLEIYDVDKNSWTNGTDMPFKIGYLSSETINGKIYLIGGTNRQHTFQSIDNVFEYDPEISEFTSIDTTYLPDSIQVTSSVDGMIYLVPADTEKDLDQIRMVCLDSIETEKNISFIWTMDTMDNGTYWLYATDVNANISVPVAFTVSGVGIAERRIEDIRIYPNPTNTILTIETGISDLYSVKITSLNGQFLLEQEMEGTTHQLDLSSFQKGVYFITIRSKDFATTRKIIKMF